MHSSICSVKLIMAAALLLSGLPIRADWDFRAPHDPVPHNAEEYVWQEEKVDLPAYPSKEKMLQIIFDRPNPRFEFFVDPETLSVGEDGVVRYVMMLRSRSGSENIMYEGIRCTQGDYKTLAFGTVKGQFRRLKRPAWKEITQTSNNWFRYDLWKDYFCGGGGAQVAQITRENILRRINGDRPTQTFNN